MPDDRARRLWPLRLALVDDDALVRFPLAAMLADAGVDVTEYAGGPQAAAGLLADPFIIDAVLTDVNMPGLDGAMLAQTLWHSRPSLPVVFMSGLSRPACARIFLAKPFSLDELLKALDLALSCPLTAPL